MTNKTFKLISGSEVILRDVSKTELIEVLNLLNKEEINKINKRIICNEFFNYRIIENNNSFDIEKEIIWN